MIGVDLDFMGPKQYFWESCLRQRTQNKDDSQYICLKLTKKSQYNINLRS